MPFTPSTAYQPTMLRAMLPEADEEDTFGEKTRAAFATENLIGAFLTKESNLPSAYTINPDYNPWDDLTDEERVDEAFLDDAVNANNPTELDAVRRQVGKERDNRSKLTGVDGTLLSMAAGVLDPINLIPVGGTAYKTYRTGGSILKNAMVTASVAGTSAGAQEALLHTQQLERTFGESALNVTGATVLGMGLGALAGKLSKAESSRLLAAVERDMDLDQPYMEGGAITSEGGSVGAAAAWKDIQIKGKAGRFISKALPFDPLTRILTGKSEKARQTLVELAENPMAVDGYTGQAVESLAKVRKDALLYRGLRSHLDIFKAYKKQAGQGKMKRREFNELVARELRNPGSVDDEFVSQSAKEWKAQVYDPQFKAINEARLLPEDIEVKTAQQYLNRVWNKHKVAGNLPKFESKVSRWLAKRYEADLEAQRLAKAEADALPKTPEGKIARKEIMAKVRKVPEDLEQADHDMLASEIAGRIMSTPDGALPYSYKIGSGAPSSGSGKGKLAAPFKGRVFDIADDLVEEFLENDIEKLASRYLRQTSTDIEIVNRFGDPKIDPAETIAFIPQRQDITDEFRDLMNKAKTEKQRLKLEGQMNKTLADLQGITDRMRGEFDLPDAHNPVHRFMHAARNLNFLRFMGGVTVSSVPDMGRLVMAEGFTRSFGTMMRPLIKGFKGAKLAAEDVRYWGIGTDAITGGRLEVVSDINDYALGGTKLERGLQSMANTYGNINLMNQWTTLMKVTHGISMQSRAMDDMLKGKFDARMENLGIAKHDMQRIMEQVNKHGHKDGNAWIYNAKNWDDQSLAFQWAAAMKKENDRVIIVPGQEKPLFMSREWGKTVMQFKSFMTSATQRVLIAGLQGQDAHAIQGYLSMITLGAMTYAIKQIEAGRPVSDDPAQWFMEGIDRSGALGALMEINNTVEKVSSNNFGLRPMLGVSDGASRYATRNVKEALMGPTWGSLLSTTMRVASAATSEYEWTEGDTSATRRLLPYQNLLGVRTALNQIEAAIHD